MSLKPRVGVGILGTGWGCRVQIPVFRAAGLEIAALWGRTPEKARAKAEESGVPFFSADWREVIEHPEVDLVSVVTPPHLHREISVAALEAGKHVLCDKPTALDTVEAEAMAAAAAAHPDRWALIDHELRFVPSHRRMRETILAGELGEIFHLDAEFSGHGRLGTAWGHSWWSDRQLGGGILGAAASHLVDFLTWLTGLEVTEVSARLRTLVSERADGEGRPQKVTSDDYAALLLSFGDGVPDSVPGAVRVSSAVAGRPRIRVLVAGSEGSLRLEGRRVLLSRPGADTRGEAKDLTVPELQPLPADLSESAFHRGTLHLGRALAQALKTGDATPLAPAATFNDGLYVQRVLDAARESDRRRGWVDLG